MMFNDLIFNGILCEGGVIGPTVNIILEEESFTIKFDIKFKNK